MKKLLLSATLLVASFTSVNAQVFTENWTTPNAGWISTQFAPDADTNFWGVASLASGPLMAQGNFAISNSWTSAEGALTPNNLLISPRINTTALTGALSLSFKVGSNEPTADGFYAEYLSVYVCDGYMGLPAAIAGTPVHSAVLTAGEQMFSFNYNISSMLGVDSLMLVFRHHNCTDMNFIMLDDIMVSNTAGVAENTISSNVFPNPTNSILNIEVAEEVATVEVVTMDGKTVARSTSKNIDVAELKTGMYIYRVTTVSGNIGTGNFVKN